MLALIDLSSTALENYYKKILRTFSNSSNETIYIFRKRNDSKRKYFIVLC